MTDFDIVMEKLQSFESEDELAEYFRDYGILAEPNNSRQCAISAFVVAETGLSSRNIITNTQMTELIKETLDEDTYSYNVETVKAVNHTNAMRKFVYNFDRGVYPFLIDPSVEYVEPCSCSMCNDPDF